MYIHAPRPDALSLSVVELVHGHMLLAAPPAEFREQNRAVTALVTPRKLVRRLLLRQLLTNDRSTPRELLLVQMAVVVRVHLFEPLPATTNSPSESARLLSVCRAKRGHNAKESNAPEVVEEHDVLEELGELVPLDEACAVLIRSVVGAQDRGLVVEMPAPHNNSKLHDNCAR